MRHLKQQGLLAFGILVALFTLAGCGSPPDSFTIAAAPASVILANYGPAQALTITVTAVNGFKNPVNVAITGLASGVKASPASLTMLPGTLQQVMLSSQTAAVVTTPNVQITGTSGTLTEANTASIQVTEAQTTAALNNAQFGFGNNIAGNVLTRPVVKVTDTGVAPLTMHPVIKGDPSFTLATGGSACGETLKAGASCNVYVAFSPTSATLAAPAGSLDLGLGNVSAGTPQTVILKGSSFSVPAGAVTATANPQVAQYTVNLPYPGSVTVEFGTGTTYGRSTSAQVSATAGPVTILVAGMLPLTTYHMRGSVTLNNGIKKKDADQVFTTRDSLLHPVLSAVITPGATPQPGIELLTMINGNTDGLVATDLNGNVVWTYRVPNSDAGNHVEGAQLLTNGHFLITLGQTSYLALNTTTFPTGSIDAIREIDLAGNIIRQITTVDLSDELAASGHDIKIQEFSHEAKMLPNGHWLVIANYLKPFQDLPGYPGTTQVLGDAVVELDTNLQPVWVWDSFDHLDVNRHPWNFPDWTHMNAVVYSPSDGNLLLSLRHQNWVVKIDYRNGTGTGNVLWRLGQGGDFTLMNGTDPTDWPYAQHYPSFFSANTSGVFDLGLMDNGDDRIFPTGLVCDSAGAPPCLYTTIPIFRLDENAKTATLLFHKILPPSLYSFFGGNMGPLANGDVEYDLAGAGPNTGSTIFEAPRDANARPSGR